MNQDASTVSVAGDFENAAITVPQGEARFTHEGDRYWMTLFAAGQQVRKFLVTRTVGSRFMQFYIGLQVEGPEPKDQGLYVDEARLPFAYWFKLKRWLPQNYFDPIGPEHATVRGSYRSEAAIAFCRFDFGLGRRPVLSGFKGMNR